MKWIVLVLLVGCGAELTEAPDTAGAAGSAAVGVKKEPLTVTTTCRNSNGGSNFFADQVPSAGLRCWIMKYVAANTCTGNEFSCQLQSSNASGSWLYWGECKRPDGTGFKTDKHGQTWTSWTISKLEASGSVGGFTRTNGSSVIFGAATGTGYAYNKCDQGPLGAQLKRSTTPIP